LNKGLRILLIVLCILALVSIRAFASHIFYDPLISFFKGRYTTDPLPEMDVLGLVLNVSMRFWMNTIITLVILWLLFQKREVVVLSLWLGIIVFVLLLLAFVIFLDNAETGAYMPLFYTRRFLIHPMLLLLLVPSFYFHKLRK